MCSMEIALTNQPDVPLVAHVANPLPNKWEDILSGLTEAGVSFKTVDATEWVEAVDKSKGDDTTNPSRKMLSMWRGAVSRLESRQTLSPSWFSCFGLVTCSTATRRPATNPPHLFQQARP